MAKQKELPFWKTVPLNEMSKDQWESLCDGCGMCCLQKLQDDETDEVYYTRVVCQHMSDQCQCTVYQERHELVPNCVWLKPEDVESFFWLPEMCSYRLIHEGKELPKWHPLVSGDRNSTMRTGHSVLVWSPVKDNVIPEDEWFDYIIAKA